MVWVKRNLGLVIGAVIAIVLLGVAGAYLWQQRSEDQRVTGELDTATTRFQELLNRPLHPGGEGTVNNIDLAKQENERLQKHLDKVRMQFGKNEVPTNISNREFRALLDNTVADLQKKANDLGISLPQKDYWFTFSPQRTAVEFKSIEMLTHQLLDVRDLCEILYDAKVHDLKGIRRVPASSDDNSAQDFMTDKKPTTNEFAIVTPYEVKFQGFSSELGRVLDRLLAAKRCFIVRSVAVDHAQDAAAAADAQTQMPSNYALAMRYGGRYAPPPPPPTTQPRSTRPPGVILDENKLLIELRVDVVRLKDPAPGKTATRQVAQNAQ
jgi:hypothetical protein